MSHDTKDKEVWRQWRKEVIKNLYCATASTISSFFGHHYTSFRQTLLDVFVEKQPDPFAAKAMKHGEEQEVNAKHAYMSLPNPGRVVGNGEKTVVVGFVDTVFPRVDPTFIMITPDMVIERDGHNEIVEFKCPYFDIFVAKNRDNRTIEKIAADFLVKNHAGKESSFMQAAVYALCMGGIEWVNVVYYFTDYTEEKSMVVYTYDLSKVMFFEDMLVDAAARIRHELQQEPGDIKYRTKSQDKLNLTRAMQNAHYDSRLYSFDVEKQEWIWTDEPDNSDEQSTNYSEESWPEEPGEPSTGALPIRT